MVEDETMRDRDDDLSVGEVAGALGISVRTLHYWDERGLVVPSGRTYSNYRLYSPADVTRLHAVLLYRATGMSLSQIAAVLDTSDDPAAHLRRQRELLAQKLNDVRAMIGVVDTLLEETMTEKKLTQSDISELLNDAGVAQYADEAKERWGDSADWAASQRSLGKMSSEDWGQLKQATEAVEAALAAGMLAGIEPGSTEANRLAEQHRELLSAFYPVSHSKHALLANMYTADPRFAAHYDDRASGLAAWLRGIIEANGEAHGLDLDHLEWK